jgi:hypothetical protein
VTVPDQHDLGLPFDPLKRTIKTDVGEVRPVVIFELLNMENQRRAEVAAAGNPQQEDVRPVQLNDPLTERETTARVADIIISEWEQFHQHFPLVALSEYLDSQTAKTMELALEKGWPLDRDAVRRALGGLLHDDSK